MKIIYSLILFTFLIASNGYSDVMKNGQIVGLDSTNVANSGLKGGNLVSPFRATLDMYITGLIKPDSLLLGSSNTSFRSTESEIIASSDTLQILGLKLKALASNTNSPPIMFISNTGGTLKLGSIYGAYGADPYIVFTSPNDAGVETPVFHLHDTSIAFVTDNTVDIGGVSDNRPKDIYIAGHFIGSSVKGDSLRMGTDTQFHRDSADKIATNDTLKAAAFQGTDAVLWGPSIADFIAVATDSVASAGVAADTSMARTSWQQYFSWDSATSPSLKTGIYSQVFIPTGSLNPDSLLVNLWFDGTAADADSGAIMIVVKDTAGTVLSTGWVTVAVASTWQHNAYVMASGFTKQQEYSMQVYMKSVSGGRWCWSCPRFK